MNMKKVFIVIVLVSMVYFLPNAINVVNAAEDYLVKMVCNVSLAEVGDKVPIQLYVENNSNTGIRYVWLDSLYIETTDFDSNKKSTAVVPFTTLDSKGYLCGQTTYVPAHSTVMLYTTWIEALTPNSLYTLTAQVDQYGEYSAGGKFAGLKKYKQFGKPKIKFYVE